MTSEVRKVQNRRKLLRLLSRKEIEELVEIERPWDTSRAFLEERILNHWPHDEVEEMVKDLMERAK